MSQGSYRELCVDTIKKRGARVTKPRLAVIDCLSVAQQPLSPRQILTRIRQDKQTPDIDKVSVYRILEMLLQFGLVHQLSPEGKFIACEHADCSLALHILTHCTVCGSTTEHDVPEEVLAPMRWYLHERLSFTPREHFIQIDGRCGKCG